jgi:hypothetical protein
MSQYVTEQVIILLPYYLICSFVLFKMMFYVRFFHLLAQILNTILGIQIPKSGPYNMKSKPFIDYVTQDFPVSATSSRSKVCMRGLQEVTELSQIFVE